MRHEKTIGVVVPAYNEEQLIEKTLASVPDFVDRIIVVNDGSRDTTAQKIRARAAIDPRVFLIDHEKNKGLGQSLIDGYEEAKKLQLDVVAVMAGDGQMDPADLPTIVDPIALGVAEYSKGNRLLTPNVAQIMPRHRYLGNAVLTLLTKFSTGYWHVIDPQCGYTAISHRALSRIPIHTMIRGYGYNAHILFMLNLVNARVADVEVRPVYGDEQSKIRLRSYIPIVSRLLLHLFFSRLFRKYLVREFHPLVLFYAFALVNIFLISLPLFIRFFYMYFVYDEVPKTTLILFMFAFTMGFFSFFFGMWLDMEDNRRFVYGR